MLLDTTENGAFELPTVVIQSGCVSQEEALIWGRCPGASDMLAMVSSSEDFTGATMFSGPSVDATTDYTGKVMVTGLTAGSQYWYKVVCGDDESPVGKFKTAASAGDAAPVKFVWVADMGGQGWGRSDDLTITDFDGEYCAEVMSRVVGDNRNLLHCMNRFGNQQHKQFSFSIPF